MKITFLGTGTSIGVPCIGCTCEVCRSSNPKDKRLRTSALIETDSGLRILIDCGPDFRQQILNCEFTKIDAVLITHIHYDHVSGIDDLRPFVMFGDIDIYAQNDVIKALHSTMPYCFKEKLYPGVPHLRLHKVESGKSFTVTRPYNIDVCIPPSGASLTGVMNKEPHMMKIPSTDEQIEIMPIRIMHGELPILGYRIGNMAYITDMKSIEEESLTLLTGIETLIVNALRFEKPHHSHQLVNDAIELANRLGVRKTYLTHLTHDIGTHDIANKHLPKGFEFAYDGLTININNVS